MKINWLDPHISRPPLARVVAGLVVFVWGTIRAFHAVSEMEAADFLISCVIIVVGGALLGPVVAQLIAGRAGKILYPGEHLSRPRPIYSIPESKRRFGKYEEAITALRTIVEDYPDELEAWTEMLDIVISDLKDAGRARLIYLEGKTALSKAEDKERFSRTYRAQIARLERLHRAEAHNEQLSLDFLQDTSTEEVGAHDTPRLEAHNTPCHLDLPRDTTTNTGETYNERQSPEVLQDTSTEEDVC